YQTEEWGAAANPLVRALRYELNQRVKAGRGDEVGDAWHWLLGVHYPLRDLPLESALLSAAMLSAERPVRTKVVSKALLAAMAAPDPAAVTQRTLAALWARRALGEADYRQLIELLPTGFPVGRFFDRFLREITAGSAKLEHV